MKCKSLNSTDRKRIHRGIGWLFVVGLLVALVSCGGGEKEKPSTSKAGEKSETPQETKTPQAGEGSMKVMNALPEIKTARFVGESKSMVQVAVEAADADGDPVSLRYAWTVNGESVDADSDTLTGVKRGDKIQVLITPTDGKQDGAPKGLFTMIQNHSPRIDASEPQFNGSNWSLQINASDADGDPLHYALASGPEGLKVDENSGMITWNTSGVAVGTYPVTVEVSDGQGGKTPWPFKIVLGVEPGASEE